MSAINFIQQHGVEKARKVIDGAPENSICYDLEHGKHVAYEDTSIAMCFLKSRFIDLSDLKRLVESVDLVNLKGGVKKLKKEADCLFHNDVEGVALRYEQAIADYEEIFRKEDA